MSGSSDRSVEEVICLLLVLWCAKLFFRVSGYLVLCAKRMGIVSCARKTS